MATYFATFGFPHGEKKKPVLIHGPNKTREEQRAAFQEAAMSKTNPKYSEIHLLSSSRGVLKKKRFEKGPWKNRDEASAVAEEPPSDSEGDFKPTEVVYLKSGSPALTILSIDEAGSAELQYSNGQGGYETTRYHVNALTRQDTTFVVGTSPFVTTSGPEIPDKKGASSEAPSNASAASPEGLGSNDSEDARDNEGGGEEEE